MITFKNISKIYNKNIVALENINFDIETSKFTIILGPSGSGKSTTLNILGGMDKPTSGEFIFDNKNISNLNYKELSDYRKNIVGFVFQFYNLIPNLTAYENIAIAAKLTNNENLAYEYLEKVGLSHRKNNFPKELSGGEMQRVSIARALAKKPKLLLCDEPTGALDSVTGEKIIELLINVAKTTDTAVVMVTHNNDFEKYADKIIKLQDGKII